MRIDKFLKVARVIKRRTIANEMADKGRIFVKVMAGIIAFLMLLATATTLIYALI